LTRASFTGEVWRRREFGLVYCLDRVDRTGEEGLTRGGDIGIGDRATVGAKAVMS